MLHIIRKTYFLTKRHIYFAGSNPVARSLQVNQDTAEGVDIGLLMSAEERKLPGALFFDVLDHFKPGVFIQRDGLAQLREEVPGALRGSGLS